ncbi:TfoX/Sxy family protein [Pedobacter sp. SYSU D00535]|uniref:TfoX/Sxy family protein n=1 Tax=Pedobacter sp. SYSU D00535 TaxID=2810308 RepID=UPI001F6236D4|nr:TfoX/Sxy family protein [Pedobacter sp. SYSU D00535]
MLRVSLSEEVKRRSAIAAAIKISIFDHHFNFGSMAYNSVLADRIREYLADFPDLEIEEKTMFGGVAFLVNGKMCVNVSGEDLMCRFDAALQDEVAERPGFRTMIMRGKELKGYCYVDPTGFNTQKEFEYWLKLCLDYNDQASSSKKGGRK